MYKLVLTITLIAGLVFPQNAQAENQKPCLEKFIYELVATGLPIIEISFAGFTRATAQAISEYLGVTIVKYDKIQFETPINSFRIKVQDLSLYEREQLQAALDAKSNGQREIIKTIQSLGGKQSSDPAYYEISASNFEPCDGPGSVGGTANIRASDFIDLDFTQVPTSRPWSQLPTAEYALFLAVMAVAICITIGIGKRRVRI